MTDDCRRASLLGGGCSSPPRTGSALWGWLGGGGGGGGGANPASDDRCSRVRLIRNRLERWKREGHRGGACEDRMARG
eukprot:CAMPEP_0181196140 /NCGR_PEP_ID=MMETSP1096-20121128/15286_1 /TAXON_ID=156174 ORGANISM="Chrysochromulina ericina, Strain CCMP281" /NCGR_SAMPLE_ID=MMETSP1096 /ASSEMBLY_ACC=CAM_ASM_000453 /LENGTH=77 /DNA_ID=CAMNT_0023285839 /DNA_START=403 /DNA_END=632 /DNA_ORIENTATION=-